jgi:hypothetical protein
VFWSLFFFGNIFTIYLTQILSSYSFTPNANFFKAGPVISAEKLAQIVHLGHSLGATNMREFLTSPIFDEVCLVLPNAHKGSRSGRHRQRWKSNFGKKEDIYYRYIEKG